MAAHIAYSLCAPTLPKAAAYMHLSSWNTPSPVGMAHSDLTLAS